MAKGGRRPKGRSPPQLMTRVPGLQPFQASQLISSPCVWQTGAPACPDYDVDVEDDDDIMLMM
eukprot:4982249-Lingulodinium_polyedra.AAC.1